MRLPFIRGLPLLLLVGLPFGACAQEATDAITREVSLYNAPDDSITDAITREVSLFMSPPDETVDAITREVSLFLSQPDEAADAITREVSLFNPAPNEVTDAITREVSFWNPAPDEATDAITREVSTYLPPYTVAEAFAALRIAGGLNIATADDGVRLDVIYNNNSQGKIQVPDATKVLRLALKLDP